jgi:hypothetical protein
MGDYKMIGMMVSGRMKSEVNRVLSLRVNSK